MKNLVEIKPLGWIVLVDLVDHVLRKTWKEIGLLCHHHRYHLWFFCMSCKGVLGIYIWKNILRHQFFFWITKKKEEIKFFFKQNKNVIVIQSFSSEFSYCHSCAQCLDPEQITSQGKLCIRLQEKLA